MRLALLLYKYFPYGGLQRDFRCFVQELQQRGHQCRVYYISWQGEPLAGADLRRVPAFAISNYRRNERFLRWVQSDLARDPVDGVIGFNKMPGLDVYYAADPCYLDKALTERGWLYRQGARYRHFAAWERAVFEVGNDTDILLISETERAKFEQHYHTQPERLHLLPPGVSPDRRAPPDAPARRKAMRQSLDLEAQELVLLLVGSGFITKGLDRAIHTVAKMREAQPSVKVRLLVVGQDNERQFKRLSKRLDVTDRVTFLGGRDDVADLMLGADLLIHPARAEAAGVVLLEAVVAGLPIVVTDVCGYAHHVVAARAGIVLPAPFSQKQLDRAVMRYIDGVFRADCRSSALLYSEMMDLYSMHSTGADLMVNCIRQKLERADD
ncbi:MAG: glycosyltransferase family 1 protein [Gammaproteobacteria bacterium]|nr:MAG: glycosyltransferase family 1 protein [Gammaproteobacteria bacterium]